MPIVVPLFSSETILRERRLIRRYMSQREAEWQRLTGARRWFAKFHIYWWARRLAAPELAEARKRDLYKV